MSQTRAYGWWILCGSIALSAPAASAAEPPPAREDGISAAKRDYEAIKALRAPAEQQRLDLPKTVVPELKLTDDAPATPVGPPDHDPDPHHRRRPGDPKPGAKSKNWLLDAMKAEKERERSGTAATEEKAQAWTPEPSDGKAPAGGATAADAPKAGAKPDKPMKSQPLPNAFDSFMSDWVTPRDYTLLKRADSPAGGPAADAGLPPPTSLDPAAAPLAGDISGPLLASKAAPDPVLPAPRANPYLEPFNLPAPAAAVPGPSLLPPPKPPESAAPNFAPPPETKAPSNVDRFRERDDAKYFPQLKRF